jgi:hypothetical protein
MTRDETGVRGRASTTKRPCVPEIRRVQCFAREQRSMVHDIDYGRRGEAHAVDLVKASTCRGVGRVCALLGVSGALLMRAAPISTSRAWQRTLPPRCEDAVRCNAANNAQAPMLSLDVERRCRARFETR